MPVLSGHVGCHRVCHRIGLRAQVHSSDRGQLHGAGGCRLSSACLRDGATISGRLGSTPHFDQGVERSHSWTSKNDSPSWSSRASSDVSAASFSSRDSLSSASTHESGGSTTVSPSSLRTSSE